MFNTITRVARRMLAGSPPTDDLMREFADATAHPLVLPLLLEAKLYAGNTPLTLHLAAALYDYLREESPGGRQFVLSKMLTAAAGHRSLIDGYHPDEAAMDEEHRGPTMGPTPARKMQFRLVNGQPVPVLRGESQPDMVPLISAALLTGLPHATLVALYRVAAGEAVAQPGEGADHA